MNKEPAMRMALLVFCGSWNFFFLLENGFHRTEIARKTTPLQKIASVSEGFKICMLLSSPPTV